MVKELSIQVDVSVSDELTEDNVKADFDFILSDLLENKDYHSLDIYTEGMPEDVEEQVREIIRELSDDSIQMALDAVDMMEEDDE